MKKYLLEVKNRFLLILIGILSALCVSYYCKNVLLFCLIKPHNVKTSLSFNYFIFTNVTDLVFIYLKLIYFFISQITLLMFIYHLFAFLNTTFSKQEYYFTIYFLKFFLVIWVSGIFLSKYIFIPYSWEFFLSFQKIISDDYISLYFEPKINDYFSFCFNIYNICVFYCQVFAVLFYLIWMYNIKSMRNVKVWRRFHYFGFFILSTVITPPDIFSQLIISLSFIFFYEIFIFFLILKDKL